MIFHRHYFFSLECEFFFIPLADELIKYAKNFVLSRA